MNHNDGAFAEYIIVKPGPRAKTPDNVTDEEAATLGVAITTVVSRAATSTTYQIQILTHRTLQGQGLYKLFGLPLPNAPTSKPFPIFIYGGSTATGVIGIQLAKASGLTVITTASPRNFDYLRSLGADLVVDYNSPTAVQEIRDFPGGKAEYGWNCIGTDESEAFIEQALGGVGNGRIGSILESKYDWTLGYDALGETYEWTGGQVRHGKAEELEFATRFWAIARELLAEGKFKPIRRVVNRGGSGLEGVLKGMDDQKNGLVSAEKLVYTL